METQDFTKGLHLIQEVLPEIAILNFQPVPEILKFAEKITLKFPDTVLFMTSPHAAPENIIQAMRVGAREFLTQPFKKEEINQAINSVIRLKQQSANYSKSNGKILSVLGVKGGVGSTTIATNLAAVIAKNTGKEVLLVDLKLQMGNVALFLDVKSRYTILDVARNLQEIDPTLLKKALPKHSSGLSVLAGPTQIEEAESINIHHIEQIIRLLRELYDFIIIDLNSVFDEITIKALDETDIIFTVSTLDIPTIFNTKRCLNLFKRMGYDNEKVRLVLNRYAPVNDVNVESLEKSIEYPVFWRIPNQEYGQIIKSINDGTPISITMPRSKMSLNILDMINSFNGQLNIKKKHESSMDKKYFWQKLLKVKG